VSHRVVAAFTTLTVVLAFWWVLPVRVSGQAFWPKSTPKIPMAPTWVAQKAKLPPYTPPRTPDGVPDLQGIWDGAGGDGAADIEDHEWLDATTPAQETFISDPPNGKIPYTPWAMAEHVEIRKGLGRGWPGESGERTHGATRSLCLNTVPRINVDGGQEIIQKPGYVIILSSEVGNFHRVIPTDPRPHVGQNAKFWFGNSRGHWEGDTLVVEVTNLNGRGWFDTAGNFFTENTRMVERWRLAEANIIDYQVTIEDPTIYTRPWTMNFPKRRAGTDQRRLRAAAFATLSPAERAAAGYVENTRPRTTVDPYAKEVWEEPCFEGNHENTITQHESGFKWYRGVTPPK
jgi:hypothetical protein